MLVQEQEASYSVSELTVSPVLVHVELLTNLLSLLDNIVNSNTISGSLEVVTLVEVLVDVGIDLEE